MALGNALFIFWELVCMGNLFGILLCFAMDIVQCPAAYGTYAVVGICLATFVGPFATNIRLCSSKTLHTRTLEPAKTWIVILIAIRFFFALVWLCVLPFLEQIHEQNICFVAALPDVAFLAQFLDAFLQGYLTFYDIYSALFSLCFDLLETKMHRADRTICTKLNKSGAELNIQAARS
jgi:hypothetical protein